MDTIEVVDLTDHATLEADGDSEAIAIGARIAADAQSAETPCAIDAMDEIGQGPTCPDALVAKTRGALFDATGKQFGAALKRPTIGATARAQIQAAKQLFDVGEVEKGLEAFYGVGVRPTARYLIKHGDKLALNLLHQCAFGNAAMPEKVAALHQIIVAYRAAGAYDKLVRLGLILDDRGMIELAFLIDAALRGRAPTREFPV